MPKPDTMGKIMWNGRQQVSGYFGQHFDFKKMFLGNQMVQSVHFKFNPFDEFAAGPRTLLNEMRKPKWKKSNPNCIITHQLLTKRSKESACITVNYVAGTTRHYRATCTARYVEDMMKWESRYIEGAGATPAHVMQEYDAMDDM